MSTNARIGIERPAANGITSIYTHWDGYPSHHGILLLDHYDTREKVEALIALGDLSILNKDLGQQHDFDARYDDPVSGSWCRAYGRDRGETDVAAVGHGYDDWPDSGQEYEYLFTRDGWKWREATYQEDDGNYRQVWGKWLTLTPSDCMAPGGVEV